MTRTHVAVVGAGLAGLYAARQLLAAKVDFLVIEARDRLGGRILTVDDSGSPSSDGFDLGPSWIWPRMQPPIAELVAELGLSAFPQNSSGDVIFERMSREGPQRYAAVEDEVRSFRLVGGSAALVSALARDLPPDRILTRARVTAMTLSGDHVTLTIQSADGATTEITANRVIAALPPRLLAATVIFTPEQDAATRQRWRETPTWMAPHAKFFALYDRAFWREAGLSGTAQSMVGPLPEIHDATTASGQPALFGFVGVGAAQRRSLGVDVLTRACIDQLVRLFGKDAEHPRATLFMDWAAEPLTATIEDQVGGAHPVPTTAPWVTGPWHAHLALAGSESSSVEPGYLAGAVVAARRAVKDVVAS